VVRGLNIQIANLAGVFQFPPVAVKIWNPEILASWAGGEDVRFSVSRGVVGAR
jgi:hypothetical protein